MGHPAKRASQTCRVKDVITQQLFSFTPPPGLLGGQEKGDSGSISVIIMLQGPGLGGGEARRKAEVMNYPQGYTDVRCIAKSTAP